MTTLPNFMDLSEDQINRFLSKIEKLPNQCWVWAGSKIPIGYGKVGLNSKTYLAHRVSYFLFKGEILEDLKLDHLCRNRLCVNPEHLEPVTQRENLHRGNTINVRNSRKVHCPKGHPYDESNTHFIKKHGVTVRMCKTCEKESSKKYLLKKKKAA